MISASIQTSSCLKYCEQEFPTERIGLPILLVALSTAVASLVAEFYFFLLNPGAILRRPFFYLPVVHHSHIEIGVEVLRAEAWTPAHSSADGTEQVIRLNVAIELPTP